MASPIYQLIKKDVGVIRESEDREVLLAEARMAQKAEDDAVFAIQEKPAETESEE
jgi:hypothetical protein